MCELGGELHHVHIHPSTPQLPRGGKEVPIPADKARNNHGRIWRISCEFLAVLRYRAVPTDPAALIQSLKRPWGSSPPQKMGMCVEIVGVSAKLLLLLPQKSTNFGQIAKFSEVWPRHLQCLMKKFPLWLLEAPAEVSEQFHACYFVVLDDFELLDGN